MTGNLPPALVMAGGRSARMRSTAGPGHKSLRQVLGVPLIERNFQQLFRAGFREIFVAISEQEGEIREYLACHALSMAKTQSATVEVLIEQQPRGTIGIAHAFAARRCDCLVVNVDNLTTLDLGDLVAHHRKMRAAMTVAVHQEPFQIPFGQVVLQGENIAEYREKPELPVLISSGCYVLSARACEQIASDQRVDAPELLLGLRDRGGRIVAYRHNSKWIDVNDAASLERADNLVACNRDFECWAADPDRQSVDLVTKRKGSEIVTERRSADCSRYRHQCDLPFEWLQDSEIRAALKKLAERFRVGEHPVAPLAVFDCIDLSVGQTIRHHLYRTPGNVSLAKLDEASPALHRAQAILRHAVRPAI